MRFTGFGTCADATGVFLVLMLLSRAPSLPTGGDFGTVIDDLTTKDVPSSPARFFKVSCTSLKMRARLRNSSESAENSVREPMEIEAGTDGYTFQRWCSGCGVRSYVVRLHYLVPLNVFWFLPTYVA